HMCVVFAPGRHARATHGAASLQRLETRVIPRPDFTSQAIDLLSLLHLRRKECGVQLARQIRRPDIDPGVFVDFSLEKPAAIGSLLPDDLGALYESGVVDQ